MTTKASVHLDYLSECVNLLNNPELAVITQNVLDDVNFQMCRGSESIHHAYEGGLVVHTAEVLKVALATCTAFPCTLIDTDVVIAAVVFHDYGKTLDYKEDGTKNDHARMIRHLTASYSMFESRAGKIDPETRMKIGHCILAHHGRFEWGSPVLPSTIEALIVHNSDMVSSKFLSKMV